MTAIGRPYRLNVGLPNGGNRRVSPVAPRPREGPLTEPTCMDRLQFASEAVLSEVADMYPAC
jgi:hypothetical protein